MLRPCTFPQMTCTLPPFMHCAKLRTGGCVSNVAKRCRRTILTTLVPDALWLATYVFLSRMAPVFFNKYYLAINTAFILVELAFRLRIFMIFHDCCHGSFVSDPVWNRVRNHAHLACQSCSHTHILSLVAYWKGIQYVVIDSVRLLEKRAPRPSQGLW
jgi:hypothetical protein